VKEFKFDRIGVFTYSVEENTPSYILGDPISQQLKEERKSILMEIQKDISLEKNQSLIGQTLRVIVDSFEGSSEEGFFIARSYKDAPEVDCEVLIPVTDKVSIGSFYDVKVYDCNEYDLFGNVI
jgi:ribosomal protein S12 methylthiotransferase